MKKLFVVLCALAAASAAFAAETCSCTAGDADCFIRCVQTKVTTARENAAAKMQAIKNA